MGLLCSMILDPGLINKTMNLPAEAFYTPANRILLSALRELSTKDSAIDFVIVWDQLSASEKEEIGGKEYLNHVWGFLPTPSNWEYYLAIVADKFDRRRAILLGQQLVNAGPEAPLNELEAITSNFRLTERKQEGIICATELASGLAQWLEMIQQETYDDSGISWGFDGLPSLVPRLRPGDLCLIGGFPGSAKTSLLNSLVAHTCVTQQRPALIISEEMTARDEGARLASIVGRIPLKKLFGEEAMDVEDYRRFRDAAQAIYDSKVAISDDMLSIGEIFSKAEQHKQEHGLELLGIDNAQLVAMSSGAGNDNDREILDRIGRMSKWMAKKLNCPVVLITQINRTDMLPYGCDSLRAHCDQYLVVNESLPGDTTKSIRVRKNRNGAIGEVECSWFGQCAAFYSGGL
jgi:replicative DNA helicase